MDERTVMDEELRELRPTATMSSRRQFLGQAGAAGLVAWWGIEELLAAPAGPRADAAAVAPAATAGGIRELRLQAPRSEQMAAFYDGVMGFAVSRLGSALEVQAGGTRLIFDPVAEAEDPLDNPVYHVAWAIPENKFAAAKAWLAERTPLLRHPDGRDEFHFRAANRHGVYFADPAGNILELIARHDLGDAAPGAFSRDDILYVNHAGLVVDDLPAAIRRIESALGLELVAEPTENFAKLGDSHRHLVLVTRERLWLPEFRVPARVFPIAAVLAGAESRSFELEPYPYRLAIRG